MNLTSLFTSTLLFLLFFNLNAQQIILRDTLNLKWGIYKSFEEFKYNNPSTLGAFDVKERDRAFKNPSSYALKIKDAPISKNDVWGFCDGQYIYIKDKNSTKGKYIYYKILMLGYYSYFEKFVPMEKDWTYYLIPRDAQTIKNLQHEPREAWFLNVNNGKLTIVDWSNVDAILKQDPEIYSLFKNDPKNRKTFLNYIDAYNLKHLDEVR